MPLKMAAQEAQQRTTKGGSFKQSYTPYTLEDSFIKSTRLSSFTVGPYRTNGASIPAT